MHGVWGYDTNKKEGVVLRENYFVKNPETGKKVEWYEDFYYPFVEMWTQRVRSAGRGCGDKMVFLEPIPNEVRPRFPIILEKILKDRTFITVLPDFVDAATPA